MSYLYYFYFSPFQLLEVKKTLKDKITLRKKVEEDVAKAKGIVNTQKILEGSKPII